MTNPQRDPVTNAKSNAEVSAYFDTAEWEASKQDSVSLQEVRAALSSIEGSLSIAVMFAADQPLRQIAGMADSPAGKPDRASVS